MTYFEDLSDYTYHPDGLRAGTKTIGWLEPGHDFEKRSPTDELLDVLWEYCKVSVVQMRGIHECAICLPPSTVLASRRDGVRRLLGTSEIRVLSDEGGIYAAPTLIYHYVRTHHYKPPDEFLRALENGLNPPSHEYFVKLKQLDLQWNNTSLHEDVRAFRFAKIGREVKRVDVDMPVYFDES